MNLGATYKDKITGFTGVATAYCQYISGCNQALIQPEAKDGDYKDSHWFDVQRLERIGHAVIEIDNGNTPGFDKSAPKR